MIENKPFKTREQTIYAEDKALEFDILDIFFQIALRLSDSQRLETNYLTVVVTRRSKSKLVA